MYKFILYVGGCGINILTPPTHKNEPVVLPWNTKYLLYFYHVFFMFIPRFFYILNILFYVKFNVDFIYVIVFGLGCMWEAVGAIL